MHWCGYKGVQVGRRGCIGLDTRMCKWVEGGAGCDYRGVQVDRGGYWDMSQCISTFTS